MYFLTTLCLGLLALFSGCEKNYVPESQPCAGAVKKTYIHKYGVEVAKNDWAFRGREGKVVAQLKTGVTVTQNYREGILDGETTYTFPHSNTIQKVEVYEQGRLTKEVENYTSEAPQREVTYLSGDIVSVQAWYENGTPRLKEEYEAGKLISATCYSMNNQIETCVNGGHGERVNRDGFGQMESKDIFSAGNLETRMLYYPNLAPKEIIPYKEGKICGQKKTFYPGGEPCTLEEWEGDQQMGITQTFQNGEKFSEVTYVGGLKNGVERRFYEGQKLSEEISWKNGLKHGPSYTYVDGRKVVDWYFGGENVTKARYDFLKNTAPVK